MVSQVASKYFKSTKTTLNLLDKPCLTANQINQIQAHLIISGSVSDPFAAGKFLASVISGHPNLSDARQLFDALPHRSHYIWNTMIQAFTERKQSWNALCVYKKMVGDGFLPNNRTFSFILRACVDLCEVSMGLIYHGQAIHLGWEGYDFVQNGLIHLYASCNCMDRARRLFDGSLNRDVITWTSVINGYARSGDIEVARQLFDQMPKKNSVSWSAMINGYVQVCSFESALELFNEMLQSGFRPNHAGLVAALTACASLGALDQGRWIHAYVDKSKMELDGVLGTALMDMYSKCGCIEASRRVFEAMKHRDVFAFTALISCLANHGESSCAIELLARMKKEGVRPNEVTFICILNACSRMGMVEEGLRVFESMASVYGIEPRVQHYGCLVDLLGGAGLLEQAKKLVQEMPMEPDSYVLGALLNACRVHSHVELGRETVEGLAGKRLDGSGVHVLLSNIYASRKQWDDVENVRKRMEERNVRKDPGCSLIEVNGAVCEFVAGNKISMEEVELFSATIDKHLKSYSQCDDRIKL